MRPLNFATSTALGIGVGAAMSSATGESVWIGIGGLMGLLLSIIRKNLKPKKAKVKFKRNN